MTFSVPYRQQPSLLLYSIDTWPVRNSRLTQRETYHYIARCTSVLAWSYLAGSLPEQLVIDLFAQHQRFAVCCPLSRNCIELPRNCRGIAKKVRWNCIRIVKELPRIYQGIDKTFKTFARKDQIYELTSIPGELRRNVFCKKMQRNCNCKMIARKLIRNC